jgi:hypothetical protein
MADSEAQAIIDKAVALARTRGHAPAIDILDLAMTRRDETAPHFEVHGQPFDDWTDETSPFGGLIRAAFGEPGAPWDEVLQLFVERYALGDVDRKQTGTSA